MGKIPDAYTDDFAFVMELLEKQACSALRAAVSASWEPVT